jgi:hypothetical protein
MAQAPALEVLAVQEPRRAVALATAATLRRVVHRQPQVVLDKLVAHLLALAASRLARRSLVEHLGTVEHHPQVEHQRQRVVPKPEARRVQAERLLAELQPAADRLLAEPQPAARHLIPVQA